MRDLRQTAAYRKYMINLGWEVVIISGENCFLKRIPLVGTHIKIQRPEKIIEVEKLKILAKKSKAYVVYIEPNTKSQTEYYLRYGYKETKITSLPSKTIRIDLTKSEKTLLSEMHSKTRYNMRLAKRRRVRVVETDKIQAFAKFWQECARRRKMFLPQKREICLIYEAFGRKAKLFFAHQKNQLLGAVMTLSTQNTAYYMYAASTKDGNANFAPTLLVWEVMRVSKKAGKKVFDFEGIFDERYPLKSWKGFTRFKKGFGGKEYEYEGPLKKYFLPL